jgi:hypothetical protein
LKELNLSGNQLTCLPHTILSLRELQHLLLYPNPFEPPPPSYSPLPTPPSSQLHQPAILRAFLPPVEDSSSHVTPSLVEFASRVLAENYILTDIDKVDVPDLLRNKIHHIDLQHKWRNRCSVCGKWYVDGPSENPFMEWYDSLHANDTVPIRRGVCSWGCLQQCTIRCQKSITEL